VGLAKPLRNFFRPVPTVPIGSVGVHGLQRKNRHVMSGKHPRPPRLRPTQYNPRIESRRIRHWRRIYPTTNDSAPMSPFPPVVTPLPDVNVPRTAQSPIGGKVLIVIPAHNEEASVAAVCRQLMGHDDWDAVIVDDASTDATQWQARLAGVPVLPLAYRLGAWGAMQTGLRYARRHGYGVVVTMDADGQHLAETIPLLLEALARQAADVIIGSYVARGSRARRIAWRFFRMLTGLDLADLTSGLRAYNHLAIALLTTPQATLLDYQDIGVLALLRVHGLRIHEIPVVMVPRRAGHSRVFHTWMAIAYYLAYTTILGFSKRDLNVSGRAKRI
jgi:hypothetical protein